MVSFNNVCILVIVYIQLFYQLSKTILLIRQSQQHYIFKSSFNKVSNLVTDYIPKEYIDTPALPHVKAELLLHDLAFDINKDCTFIARAIIILDIYNLNCEMINFVFY